MNLHHPQEQSIKNMQMNPGLTRYRSAPSSFFASFLDSGNNNNSSTSDGFTSDDFDKLFNPRASSPETKRLFASFMNNSGPVQETAAVRAQLPPRVKREPEAQESQKQPLKRQQSNDFSSNPSKMTTYQMNGGSGSTNRMKVDGGSGLIRQSSSPVGFFDSINIGNEYNATRDNVGNLQAAPNITIKAEATFSSELEDKSGDNAQFDEDGFANINAFLKELAEDDDALFLSDDTKNKEGENKPSNQLSRHQSLPADFNAVEKLLQDSVPCKLRAKRGCATHPRSIAERVRRTKISERMRKLQDLVPNMEKQTNTADMLDLAVDYIKDLQRQLEMLSQMRGNCSCEVRQR